MNKWPYVLDGDIESAVIHTLMSASEISAFPGGVQKVSSTLDGYINGQRWIVVSREGGTFDWPVMEKARVDFNVFAETRTIAYNLAATAKAVMFREMGQPSLAQGLVIIDIHVETNIIRTDDKFSDSPRFLFTLRINYVPYSYSA